MSDIKIRRAHSLSPKQARAAAEEMAGKLRAAFDLRIEWNGDVASFTRSGVAGTVTLEPKAVAVEARLGLMLRMLKPSIEKAVNENLDKIFAGDGAAAKKPAAKPKK
jgi:putative polyhydroxyalkanoate system protein